MKTINEKMKNSRYAKAVLSNINKNVRKKHPTWSSERVYEVTGKIYAIRYGHMNTYITPYGVQKETTTVAKGTYTTEYTPIADSSVSVKTPVSSRMSAAVNKPGNDENDDVLSSFCPAGNKRKFPEYMPQSQLIESCDWHVNEGAYRFYSEPGKLQVYICNNRHSNICVMYTAHHTVLAIDFDKDVINSWIVNYHRNNKFDLKATKINNNVYMIEQIPENGFRSHKVYSLI